jgi:glycosyltransferase involved in cell wall biosynthesis
MRIAHVNWLPRLAGWSGVIGKLRQQAQAVRRAGLPLEIVVVTADAPVAGDGVVYRQIPAASARPSPRFAQALCRLRLIERSVDLPAYDAVVLRYPGAADLTLDGFLARHGRRLVSEHHTDQLAELRLLATSPAGWAKLALEQMRGRRFLAGVRGIVAVTEELRRLQLARCPLPVTSTPASTVIANGIDVAGTAVSGFVPADGRTLVLVFSAARFWPWQGLDRLLAGMAAYRGPLRLVLHLLGEVEPGDLVAITRLRQSAGERIAIHAHGVLDAAASEPIYRQANLAISTLALQRKAMTAACPLKTREYVARGLPLVYAYDDPDLAADHPGWLRLPSGEAPLAIEELAAFAGRLAGPAGHGLVDGLRAYAERHLDWQGKLARLCDFVRATV